MTTEPTKAAISTSATRAAVMLLPSGQPRSNASTQTTTKNAAMTAAVHNGSATTAVRSKAEPTRPDITPTHQPTQVGRLWRRGAAEATLSDRMVASYRDGKGHRGRGSRCRGRFWASRRQRRGQQRAVNER